LFGYLLLGAKLTEDAVAFSQAYNFGPYVTDALPVAKMVEMAIESWGNGKYFVNQIANQPHEAGLLKLDISKAIAGLKWKPVMNASEAVAHTINWYKAFYSDPQKIVEFTEKQIIEFCN